MPQPHEAHERSRPRFNILRNVLLVPIAGVALTGCGGNSEAAPEQEPAATATQSGETTVPSPSETADQSPSSTTSASATPLETTPETQETLKTMSNEVPISEMDAKFLAMTPEDAQTIVDSGDLQAAADIITYLYIKHMNDGSRNLLVAGDSDISPGECNLDQPASFDSPLVVSINDLLEWDIEDGATIGVGDDTPADPENLTYAKFAFCQWLGGDSLAVTQTPEGIAVEKDAPHNEQAAKVIQRFDTGFAEKNSPEYAASLQRRQDKIIEGRASVGVIDYGDTAASAKFTNSGTATYGDKEYEYVDIAYMDGALGPREGRFYLVEPSTVYTGGGRFKQNYYTENGIGIPVTTTALDGMDGSETEPYNDRDPGNSVEMEVPVYVGETRDQEPAA